MTNNLPISTYFDNPAVKLTVKNTLRERAPQFIQSVISLVNSNQMLQDVDKNSVVRACLTAAALNLPVNQNLGFAYVIPYNTKVTVTDEKTGKPVDSWIKVAQFQMGYKGFIQLAQRSGQFKTINVSDVREGELKNIDRLTGEISFDWKQEKRDDLTVIGYVGYIELTIGFKKSLYLTVDELRKHGVKYSKTFKSGKGLWKDEFDVMAKKTVIKMLLSKYAPLSTEMQIAQEADQSIVTDDGYKYIDNTPEIPANVADEKEIERIKKYIAAAKSKDELRECEDSIDSPELQTLFDKKMKELEQ